MIGPLGGGGGGVSIGWEEDSGFLQSGMEPRGGTMGPGTAPPSHQSPSSGGIAAPALFPEPLRRVFRADGAPRWILAASPQLTFSGILGFARDDCSYWGRAEQPMGCSSSASRVEPASQPVAWPRVSEGAAPFPPKACPAIPQPWTRAVPGLRGYPGIMGVSVSLPHSLPCTLAPRL